MLRDTDNRAPTPGLAEVEHLAAIARGAGVHVTVEVDGHNPDVPASVDHAAYRILQESMANVVRHATAIQATIVLRYRDDRLRIEVRDDGTGPARPATPTWMPVPAAASSACGNGPHCSATTCPPHPTRTAASRSGPTCRCAWMR